MLLLHLGLEHRDALLAIGFLVGPPPSGKQQRGDDDRDRDGITHVNDPRWYDRKARNLCPLPILPCKRGRESCAARQSEGASADQLLGTPAFRIEWIQSRQLKDLDVLTRPKGHFDGQGLFQASVNPVMAARFIRSRPHQQCSHPPCALASTSLQFFRRAPRSPVAQGLAALRWRYIERPP